MFKTKEEVAGLFDLQGKVAVVTGGASGIGQAIAMAYAAYGTKLAILDVSEKNLKESGKLFAQEGYSVLMKQCDIRDEARVDQVFEEIVQELGPVEILVNSAGITLAKPAEETSAAEFSKVVETNVNGTFYCCRAASRSMIPRKKGKILNVGSVRGSVGVEWGMVAYGSSKGAVHMMTRQLAVEWAKYGINVNCLIPNLVITPITTYIQQNKPRYEHYISRIPMGRPGYPEDFVSAAIFFAGPGSDFITGQLLYFDGGSFAG